MEHRPERIGIVPAHSAAATRRELVTGLGAAALAIWSARLASADPVVEAAAAKLIAAGERQIGVTTLYDAAYVSIDFPNGDVPIDRGVCTDVIVRAYRTAFGIDLQAKLNADMKTDFATYPRRWGLQRPDANIDHRRVPNLQVYFKRQRAERPLPDAGADWRPGDLVTQMIPGDRPHIGIVSGRRNETNTRPLIIHNIGRGTQIDDVLHLFPITGRYRYLPE